MESLTAAEESEKGTPALGGLVASYAIAAWVVFAILLFTALAIAATLYAGNKRRQAEHVDEPW